MARIGGLLAMAALLLGPVAAMAQGGPQPESASVVSAADEAAEQAVIKQQMAAFQRDDAAAAFGFASPSIQAQFGADPESFMSMVRRGYQPVYRPRSTAFGGAERQDGQVVQRVEVVGPDGTEQEALYYMERETDGSWRIAGCMLTANKAVGA